MLLCEIRDYFVVFYYCFYIWLLPFLKAQTSDTVISLGGAVATKAERKGEWFTFNGAAWNTTPYVRADVGSCEGDYEDCVHHNVVIIIIILLSCDLRLQ